MSKLGKILIFLFIVFLLVIGVELVYLYSFRGKKTTEKLTLPKEIQEEQKTKEPAATKTPKTWFALSAQTRNVLLERMSTIKKGLLTKFVVNSEIEGKISKINLDGWTMPNGIHYKYSLQLTDPSTKNSNYLMFQEEELKKMKIILMQDGKEQPLNFTDLKIGDYVKIKHTVNLLEKDYFTGVESIIMEVAQNQTK